MQKEVKIAVLAIIALLIVIFGLKFLKGQSVFNRNQVFYCEYKDVNNLTISTPVYIHGLQVGTVTSLDLNPETLQSVIVEFEVRKDIKVPKNTIVEIKDVGFMGNKMLNLYYETFNDKDLAQSGDFLPGRVKGLLTSMLGNPQELGDYMNQVENGVTGILDTISDYFKRVDKTKGIGLAMTDLQNTVTNLRLITNQLNMLLAGSNQSLQSTFSNLNGITGNINNKSKEIGQLLDNFNAISGQIKDAELDKTIQNANTTFTTVNKRMEDLKGTLVEANTAIQNLSSVLKSVNSQDGTLGKLIHDKDLYNNLERTSKQLDLLFEDLRLNPKRYVNVSVFGKKQKSYDLPENDPAKPILDTQQQ